MKNYKNLILIFIDFFEQYKQQFTMLSLNDCKARTSKVVCLFWKCLATYTYRYKYQDLISWFGMSAPELFLMRIYEMTFIHNRRQIFLPAMIIFRRFATICQCCSWKGASFGNYWRFTLLCRSNRNWNIIYKRSINVHPFKDSVNRFSNRLDWKSWWASRRKKLLWTQKRFWLILLHKY